MVQKLFYIQQFLKKIKMKLSLRRVKSVTEIVQQSKEREIDFKKLNFALLSIELFQIIVVTCFNN